MARRKRKRRWIGTLLGVLLVGGLLYYVSLSVSTGPADGTAIEGQFTPTPPEQTALRIGTFNIHAGRGLDRRRDLARTADCIAPLRLDLLALNEVRGNRLKYAQDQAEQLGRRLEMGWLFAPSSRVWSYREAGNGLLARLPVESWQRIPLADRYDDSRRNAVLVDAVHQGRTIHVLLTHVTRGDDRDRQAQLRTVIALFRALAEPAILLGDMNSPADDPQIRELLDVPGVVDPVGEVLGSEAPRRIDWIITRGLRCLDAGVVETEASDHPLVWAEVELLPAATHGTEPE